jgi:hypothetical protein
MKKQRIVIYSVIAILLFFFFVPIYKTSVSPYLILPRVNECFGSITAENIAPTPTVYASLSYVSFGYWATGTTTEGVFGLIYVPNYGWNTIQFPPLGQKIGMACS